MNKSELVEVAAQEAGITKAAADKALSAIIAAVVKTVSKGESVTLVGFGTFKSAKRAARTGKNPKTGAPLKIPVTPGSRCDGSMAWRSGAGERGQVRVRRLVNPNTSDRPTSATRNGQSPSRA